MDCETCEVKDLKDFSQVQNMWGEEFDKDGERPRKGQRGLWWMFEDLIWWPVL